jgi:hypothetical protein
MTGSYENGAFARAGVAGAAPAERQLGFGGGGAEQGAGHLGSCPPQGRLGAGCPTGSATPHLSDSYRWILSSIRYVEPSAT